MYLCDNQSLWSAISRSISWLTHEILTKLVNATNGYAFCKNANDWTALDASELKRYFAIIIYMGIVQRPSRKSYWGGGNFGDSFVPNIMSRNRFFDITLNLHWTNTTNMSEEERKQKNKQDGFWTIECFLSALSANFRYYYRCGQCIFFKGRHRCRCYNPKKPNKWHLKAFCLNDSSSGYLWDFFMYRGKDEQRPDGVPAALWPVMKLTDDESLHGKWHVLALDNWYTSIGAVNEVFNFTKRMKGCTLLGRLR